MIFMKFFNISQRPPTSCCITMIQNRAPQNYNTIIDTVIYIRDRMSMECAREKKVSVGPPNVVGPRLMAYGYGLLVNPALSKVSSRNK